jgi:hypothetical protein
MEQKIVNSDLINSLLVEVVSELKLTNSYLLQIVPHKSNDTFSIKSLGKASKILNCCRQTLVKAISSKKLKIGIDYTLVIVADIVSLIF